MYELQLFNFESNEVRTTNENGQIWFVGKDVADVLGYERADNAIRSHVDEEDKLMHQISASGQLRNMILINESGLYSLVLSSKMPNAKKFKRWVTSEVLPTIRQTGSYTVTAPSYQISDPIERARQWIEEQKKVQALELDNKIKDQQIAEFQPKVLYHDLVLQCKELVSITKISKEYGMSGQKMNELLHEMGIQYKQGDMWLLYQKHAPYGYTQTKTNPYSKTDGTQGAKPHMYWTQKGRLFLYNTLKERGILPLIEREENQQ